MNNNNNNKKTTNVNHQQDQQLDTQKQHALKRQQVLKHALRDSNQTQEIANETSETLAKQGEQIGRISKKVDNIEQDLQTSDYHTRTIGSWFGMMWNAIKGEPNSNGSDSKAGEKAKEAEHVSIANREAQRKFVEEQQQQQRQKQNQQNNDTSQQHVDDDEKLENDLLDQLQNSVAGVHNSAKTQNSTLRAQTAALAETEQKMDNAQAHMRQTTKKINRLI